MRLLCSYSCTSKASKVSTSISSATCLLAVPVFSYHMYCCDLLPLKNLVWAKLRDYAISRANVYCVSCRWRAHAFTVSNIASGQVNRHRVLQWNGAWNPALKQYFVGCPLPSTYVPTAGVPRQTTQLKEAGDLSRLKVAFVTPCIVKS